jgi:hypothetical protein
VSPRLDRDGDHALNSLKSAWHGCQADWADDLSRRFDLQVLNPLINESSTYLAAQHKLLQLLTAAERDTEY